MQRQVPSDWGDRDYYEDQDFLWLSQRALGWAGCLTLPCDDDDDDERRE